MPLFFGRSLFSEFRLLSCRLTVDMAPAMLVPAPEWLLKRGRRKELIGPGAGQPGGDNGQRQRDMMIPKQPAKGLECPSPGPDIVSSKEQARRMTPKVAFQSGRQFLAPLPERPFPDGRALTGPVVKRQAEILRGREAIIDQRIYPSLIKSLLELPMPGSHSIRGKRKR